MSSSPSRKTSMQTEVSVFPPPEGILAEKAPYMAFKAFYALVFVVYDCNIHIPSLALFYENASVYKDISDAE